MRRRNMLNVLQVVLAIILAGVVAQTRANLVTTYSEDFEGGTDGQSLTNAPFSWTSSYNNYDMAVTSNSAYQKLDLNGMAIAGGGTWLKWIYHTKAVPVAANNMVTVLSFDSYAFLRSVDNMTSYWGEFGIYDASTTAPWGGEVRWASTDAAAVTSDDGWSFDASYVTGNSADQETIYGHLGTNVHLTINIDRVTDKIWGTLTDGATTVTTAQYTITQNAELDTLWTIRFRANADGKQAHGLNIDNILVEYELPPPPPPLPDGTIYYEDFEKDGNPQALTNAIYGFVTQAGDDVLKATVGAFLPSNVLNGNSGWAYDNTTKIMPEATTNHLLYIFSFDFHALTDDDGDANATLYNGVYFKENGQSGMGLYFQGGTNTLDSINFNASGLTGNSADNMNFYGFRETKSTATFYVNRKNNTCWATLTDGITTSNSPVYQMTQNMALDELYYVSYAKNAARGLEIDNILFRYIPPDGMVLFVR